MTRTQQQIARLLSSGGTVGGNGQSAWAHKHSASGEYLGRCRAGTLEHPAFVREWLWNPSENTSPGSGDYETRLA